MITAKEYFDDARSSALELKRLEGAIAHAKQKLIPRGHGQGDVISHGVHDPMEAVGEIIDAEKELVFRRAELRPTIRSATEVLYGQDGQGGLAGMKGFVFADVLYLYYIQAHPMTDVCDQIAESLHVSRQEAYYYRAAGLAAIDQVGIAKARCYDAPSPIGVAHAGGVG
jgi:hypothetical protein